jgi:hypothetical protein
MLYLVDPYLAYSELDAYEMANARNKMQRRLGRFTNCRWIEAPSVVSAKEVSEPLHFVYIDANHSYESVQQDIASWWPKVRSKGIIGGHDFTWEHDGVIRAVTEFSVNQRLQLRVKSPDWWIEKI